MLVTPMTCNVITWGEYTRLLLLLLSLVPFTCLLAHLLTWLQNKRN